MKSVIRVGGLADEISQELQSYTEEVDKVMQEEIDILSKEIVESLKSNPNVPEDTGEYKKSFYSKNIRQRAGFKLNVIANKLYQLTHLLEDGHLTSTGRRTKAFPHWKDAQKMADTLPERLEKKL